MVASRDAADRPDAPTTRGEGLAGARDGAGGVRGPAALDAVLPGAVAVGRDDGAASVQGTAPHEPAGPGAAGAGRSGVVAVAAGPGVGFAVINMEYEGGTTSVIWLSDLPADGGEAGDVPL